MMSDRETVLDYEYHPRHDNDKIKEYGYNEVQGMSMVDGITISN